MSFWHHPRQLRARRWLFLFHLWSGLFIGFFLTVVGVSGSILVFLDDLQKKINVYAAPQPTLPSLGIIDLERITKQKYPDAQITYISLGEAPGEPDAVSTEVPASHRGGNLYIHPQTGALLRETVSREAFLDWVYRVHVYLLAGDTGYFFNGLFAAVATALCLSGLVIWWPGVKLWRRALVVNRKARWKRINYDLHRAGGFFAALALAAVFLTGAYFRFPQPFVWMLQVMTGTTVHDASLSAPPRPLPRIAARQALAIGEAAFPNARTVALGYARPDLHYFRVDRKKRDGTQGTVAVDAYNGRVLDISGIHPPSLAEKILQWSGPVHFGTWGGRITQVLWVVLGLMPGLLFITGILMYWNRVLSKKVRRVLDQKTNPSPATLPSGQLTAASPRTTPR